MTQNKGWIPCTDWEIIPMGTWLVKINKDRNPYHVMKVTGTGDNRIVVVGNYFHWDMGCDPVAYKKFEGYEERND